MQQKEMGGGVGTDIKYLQQPQIIQINTCKYIMEAGTVVQIESGSKIFIKFIK